MVRTDGLTDFTHATALPADSRFTCPIQALHFFNQHHKPKELLGANSSHVPHRTFNMSQQHRQTKKTNNKNTKRHFPLPCPNSLPATLKTHTYYLLYIQEEKSHQQRLAHTVRLHRGESKTSINNKAHSQSFTCFIFSFG